MLVVGPGIHTDAVAQLPIHRTQALTLVTSGSCFANIATDSAMIVVGLQVRTLSVAQSFTCCTSPATSSRTGLVMGTGDPTSSAVSEAGLEVNAHTVADRRGRGALACTVQAGLSVGTSVTTTSTVVEALGEVVTCRAGAASTDRKLGVLFARELALTKVTSFCTRSSRGCASRTAGSAVVDVCVEVYTDSVTECLPRRTRASTGRARTAGALFAASTAIGSARCSVHTLPATDALSGRARLTCTRSTQCSCGAGLSTRPTMSVAGLDVDAATVAKGLT